MTLGKRLSTLRAQHGWSQDELAERVGVSRQSVSKWETDASVPDLDKLLTLSELFGLTLDALVKGGDTAQPDAESAAAPAQSANAASAPAPAPAAARSGRCTAGVVLLCFGFGVLLLLTLLGGILEGLVLAAPFFICALLCFLIKRRAGLWCAWTAVLLAELYLRFATGIRWRWLFSGISWGHTLIAGGMLLAYLLMLFFTLRAYRRTVLPPTAGRRARLIAGWALFAVLYALRYLPLSSAILMNTNRWVFIARDAAPWLLLIPLTVFTPAVRREGKSAE